MGGISLEKKQQVRQFKRKMERTKGRGDFKKKNILDRWLTWH